MVEIRVAVTGADEAHGLLRASRCGMAAPVGCEAIGS